MRHLVVLVVCCVCILLVNGQGGSDSGSEQDASGSGSGNGNGNGSGSGPYDYYGLTDLIQCTSSMNSTVTNYPYSGQGCLLGSTDLVFFIDQSVYGPQAVFWSIDFQTDVTNLSFSFTILPEYNTRPLYPQQGLQFFPVSETFSYDFLFDGLPLYGVIIVCEENIFRNNNDTTRQRCAEVEFDFKWVVNVVNETNSVQIPVQSSMTFVRVPLPSNYTHNFLPIQVEVSTAASLLLPTTNFTSLSTSSTSGSGSGSGSGSISVSELEEQVFTVRVDLFMGSPFELVNHQDRTNGIISVNSYAFMTMQRNGTIYVEMSKWSRFRESLTPEEDDSLYLRIVPNFPSYWTESDVLTVSANISLATLPNPKDLGSWAMAPMIFLIAIGASISIILLLGRITSGLIPKETRHSKVKKAPRDRTTSWSRIDWTLLTFAVAVFFITPALQMITKDLSSYAGGDRDTCYFNEQCMFPRSDSLWALNNVVSNASYVAVGLVLIAHFAYIQIRWPRIGPSNPSILYAIAVSLICEGVGSALYHLCPTPKNFQVDTVFMFVITSLSTAETLRKHLSDLSPVKAFTMVSLLVILNYFGIVFWKTNDITFRVLCTLILFVIYARIFYITARLRADWTYWAVNGLAIILALNAIWITGTDQTSAAMIILAILILTSILAQTSDVARVMTITWKASGLKAWRFFVLWGILSTCAMICWVVALYYFIVKAVTDKDKEPWDSRNGNKSCVVGWYDSHDVWHFVSSLALFFQTLLSFHFQFPRRLDEDDETRGQELMGSEVTATSLNNDNHLRLLESAYTAPVPLEMETHDTSTTTTTLLI